MQAFLSDRELVLDTHYRGLFFVHERPEIADRFRTTFDSCFESRGGDSIVHLLRNSLDFGNGKERKSLAMARRPSYTATSADAALTALDAFE